MLNRNDKFYSDKVFSPYKSGFSLAFHFHQKRHVDNEFMLTIKGTVNLKLTIR